MSRNRCSKIGKKKHQSKKRLFSEIFINIILINYLEKGRTINGEYYAALLNQLNDIIKAKHLHLAKKKMLFHDNMLILL